MGISQLEAAEEGEKSASLLNAMAFVVISASLRLC
jgi:hypothetical protein